MWMRRLFQGEKRIKHVKICTDSDSVIPNTKKEALKKETDYFRV